MQHLDRLIEEKPLLQHPFYQAWNAGRLTLEQLRLYACQYAHFEAAFPRFLSAVHSRSTDRNVRQALLTNLWDEEYGADNHYALWLRFCNGLGLTDAEVTSSAPTPETRDLIETFERLCAAEAVEGVAALYAYESQAAEVARQKIWGLQQFYGIDDERTISFFTTHLAADEAHSASESDVLATLGADAAGRVAAEAAAIEARDALWRFLDGAYALSGAAC